VRPTPTAKSGTSAPAPTAAAANGGDRDQIEGLIRDFSDRTEALDADGAIALLCQSLRDKSDLKQIRQNMEGFKNAGTSAPQISDLTFASVTSDGSSGEAHYSYTQVFRGQTSTINEGVKVAKEGGKWCVKDQLAVQN
jgi:hypothetical protein